MEVGKNMGLDELNQLSELSAGAILGVVAVLLAWALVKFLGRESSRDKQEADERANDAETERLRLEERKLSLESLTKSVEALASIGIILKTLSDDVKESTGQNKAAYETAQRMMSEVTNRRDVDFKKGVDNIRGDIDVVPARVGEVTEPQINTIREELAKLEERFGKRLDESSQAQIELIRTEIKAFSERMLARLEDMEKAVPEKVVQAILPKATPAVTLPAQHVDTAPQTAEPGAEGKG